MLLLVGKILMLLSLSQAAFFLFQKASEADELAEIQPLQICCRRAVGRR
jgi:hypothetical protein